MSKVCREWRQIQEDLHKLEMVTQLQTLHKTVAVLTEQKLQLTLETNSLGHSYEYISGRSKEKRSTDE